MDFDLSGKLALVTGPTRGIGVASAIGLARMGAAVIVNGRGQEAISDAIAEIKKAVGEVTLHGVAADPGHHGRGPPRNAPLPSDDAARCCSSMRRRRRSPT